MVGRPAGRKITGLAVEPTGARVASLGTSGELRLWDAQSLAPLGGVPRPRAGVGPARLLGWSEHGLVLTEGRTVAVREPTGALVRHWAAHGEPVGAAWWGGERVVTALRGVWRRWDIASGASLGMVRRGSPVAIQAVALGSDATRGVSIAGEMVSCLDFADADDRYGSMSNHYNATTSLDVAPDGAWFVIGGRRGNLRCLSFSLAQVAEVLDAQATPVQTVLVSPDGASVLATASDGRVRRWRLGSVMTLEGEWQAPEPVTAAARTPDGRMLGGGQRGAVFRLG